jgi:uridine kinase
MSASNLLSDSDVFSKILYEKMRRINPGIAELELYEFRYALDNLYPKPGGWASVQLDTRAEIEQRIDTRDFYIGIKLKPRVDDRVVLDEDMVRLTNMLFVGLVTGEYSTEWINAHFYFDVRGFFFLARTVYFTEPVLAHFGGKPFKAFEQKQRRFECYQGIGYGDFKEANAEVDQLFIESVKKLVASKGTPILLTIAGPTAAGKTEIVERLRGALEQIGRRVTSIEMDNFLLDNDYRDEKGINSLGKEAYHFSIFMECLAEILRGHKIIIPRNTLGVSSHDPNGHLRPGAAPLEIQPADVIFLEGNFPFQIDEVAHRIGIKIVYLTDDPIRLKRKWKRDIDYRKRYDPAYFCNRFFRNQFLRARDCYIAQMQVCDLVVDTTGAALWTTPETARMLSGMT